MLGSRRIGLLFAMALAASTSVRGDNPTQPQIGAAIPSDPVFVATLTDLSEVSGRIRQLGEPGGLTLVKVEKDAEVEQTIPFDRLVKLTREGDSPPSSREGGIVLFPDGDRLVHCRINGSGEANFDINLFAMVNLPVPIDSVLGLIPEAPADLETLDALLALVRTEPRKSELLWLANGDKLVGSFVGIDEKTVSFLPRSGKVEVDRSGVVALGFDPEQVRYPRPKGLFLELTLNNGSRLGLTEVRVERGDVVGKTRFKAEVRLPIGDLGQVHVINGSVAYLSDRDEAKSVYVPYLGPTRPYRRNASVTGRPLHLGGRAFDRGLGMQSRTLLAYRLEPGASRFQALVGLDDLAGSLGSVAFKVLVDGKLVFESKKSMEAREPAEKIDVDVKGGKILVLITEFGDRGDVQDIADWVEARIVR